MAKFTINPCNASITMQHILQPYIITTKIAELHFHNERNIKFNVMKTQNFDFFKNLHQNSCDFKKICTKIVVIYIY